MPYRMPKQSFLVKHWQAAFGWTTRLGAKQAWLVTLGSLLTVGLLDWITGREVSMGMGYLLIICFAAWTLGEFPGIGASVVTIAMANVINGFGSAEPTFGLSISPRAAAWNLLWRLVGFSMISILVSTLRYVIRLERWRAATDGLTGALNAEAFSRHMARTVSTAQKQDAWLLVANMDLDGFKEVNDSFGHAAGDRVLRTFSAGAVERLRQGDLFARVGGDEFVALLIVPSEEQGYETAEILHSRLSDILSQTSFPVTCSMGAVVLESHQVPEPSSLLQIADGLMYDVKRGGKNALRVASGNAVGSALRSAFPIPQADGFDALLKRIDIVTAEVEKRAA